MSHTYQHLLNCDKQSRFYIKLIHSWQIEICTQRLKKKSTNGTLLFLAESSPKLSQSHRIQFWRNGSAHAMCVGANNVRRRLSVTHTPNTQTSHGLDQQSGSTRLHSTRTTTHRHWDKHTAHRTTHTTPHTQHTQSQKPGTPRQILGSPPPTVYHSIFVP